MDASDELVLSETGFAFHHFDWQKWEHKVQSALATYKGQFLEPEGGDARPQTVRPLRVAEFNWFSRAELIPDIPDAKTWGPAFAFFYCPNPDRPGFGRWGGLAVWLDNCPAAAGGD
jgi:hypothetical protein